MDALRNEISHHIDLFSSALLGGKWKDMMFDTCQIQAPMVTMDIYTKLVTHAEVLPVRWMLIN